MSTTDGKAPRLEIVSQHEDGDIVVTLEATFRGDVRKLMAEVPEGMTKEDAELGVAGQIFRIIQNATESTSDPDADRTTPPED